MKPSGPLKRNKPLPPGKPPKRKAKMKAKRKHKEPRRITQAQHKAACIRAAKAYFRRQECVICGEPALWHHMVLQQRCKYLIPDASNLLPVCPMHHKAGNKTGGRDELGRPCFFHTHDGDTHPPHNAEEWVRTHLPEFWDAYLANQDLRHKSAAEGGFAGVEPDWAQWRVYWETLNERGHVWCENMPTLYDVLKETHDGK